MVQKKIIHATEVFTISSSDGSTHASLFPQRGGVGSSIIMPDGDKQRELLFLHEYFWQKELSDLPGGWPFLFPVCARVERNGSMGSYLFEGHIYQMPMHGFAWRSAWEVLEDQKPDELVMGLRDDGSTHSKYFPFSFEIKLFYKVTHGILTCEQVYTNLSDRSLPYYAGFHPYFLTPPPGQGKEQVILDYQPTHQYRYNERYTDLVGECELFQLPTAIVNPKINEQLTKVGTNKVVRLIYPDGFKLQIMAAGIEDSNLFSYIQLYTIPEKPFFCVEPWMSFPQCN